jgi:hypothetical protein
MQISLYKTAVSTNQLPVLQKKVFFVKNQKPKTKKQNPKDKKQNPENKTKNKR